MRWKYNSKYFQNIEKIAYFKSKYAIVAHTFWNKYATIAYLFMKCHNNIRGGISDIEGASEAKKANTDWMC